MFVCSCVIRTCLWTSTMKENCLWFPYMKVKHQRLSQNTQEASLHPVVWFQSSIHLRWSFVVGAWMLSWTYRKCISVKKNLSGFIVDPKVSSGLWCSLRNSVSTSCCARARRRSWLNRKSSCRYRMWVCLWSTTAAARRSPLLGSQGI